MWSVRSATPLCLVLAAVLAGCEPQGQGTSGFTARPGAPVVLISIDTLRSDRLPAYGYTGVETPAIDALRADAILFEKAWSHYPLTLPAHVSLMTGQLPTATGVRDNAGYRLEADYPTHLPRLLKDAGYATGAAVSSYAIRATTGLAQGFDHYDDDVDDPAGNQADGAWGPERAGSLTLARAVEWLDRLPSPEAPFFLFFHLYEPHLPHAPPEPHRTRYGDTYEAEIATADEVVGALTDELRDRGLYDDAMIILLSDHGEGLGDHGEKGHGIFLYREALQVPLIVKLPGGGHAGAAVTATARLIDVMPTVLRVLGQPVPENVAGLSLLELLEPGAPERPVYAETMYPRIHYGWSELTAMIEGRYHYIEAPEPELYDLETDPAQEHNVLAEERGTYFRLRESLEAIERPLELPAEEDEETRKKLAALGYLSTSRGDAEGDLPDPKIALAQSLAQMERAFSLFDQGDFEAAVPAFETLLDGNPQMTDAWRHLGMALNEIARPGEALDAFERAMQLSRGSPQVAVQLGMTLLALGRIDEARAHAELAREREPVLAAELGIDVALAEGDIVEALRLAEVRSGAETVSAGKRLRLGLALSEGGRHREAIDLLSLLAGESETPPVLNALAQAMLAAGRPDEAEELVARVLELAPGNAVALEHKGLAALQRGQAAAAREALERAVAADERLANAWNLLGVARFQMRDVEGALDAWERSTGLDPEQWDSLYNLGFTAARAGQRERARRALSRYVDTAPPGRFRQEIADARRLLAQLES